MTEIENFWAKDILDFREMRFPKTILKIQAKYLEDMTKGVLLGEVSSTVIKKNNHEFIRNYLTIKAPFMGNYKTDIIYVDQKMPLIYPVEVYSIQEKYYIESVESYERLKEVIAVILGSSEVVNILKVLLAQSEVGLSDV